jgi:tetratricopeptide (TPR) repeat protein
MDKIKEPTQSGYRQAKFFVCLLLGVAVVLTSVYWPKVKELSWFWKVVIIIGYSGLIRFLFSSGSESDERAKTNVQIHSIRSLISHKRYPEALVIVKQAITSSPENADLFYAKGECLQNMERIKEAEQAYLKVLELNSSHAFTANNLATLYMNTGQYIKAAEYYRQAKKAGASGDWFDRNLHRIWNNLLKKGSELAQSGDLLVAVEYFLLSKEFGAEGTTFSNNLQVLKNELIAKGKAVQNANPQLAMEYLEAILSLDPEFAIAYAWRGSHKCELGNYNDAIKDLQHCLRLNPNYEPAKHMLREVELAQKNFKKSEKAQNAVSATQEVTLPKPRRTNVDEYNATLVKPDRINPPVAGASAAKQVDGEKAEEKFKSCLWQVGELAFGRFLVKKIISGGMGHVYCGWDQKSHSSVALKSIILDTGGPDHNLKMAFQREAENWRQLGKHPNIVTLYTVEKYKFRHLILVMEYVTGISNIGATLQDHLHIKGKLAVKEAVKVAIGICKAMEFAYDKAQLVHRDLKPQNVFITSSGLVKVGDFGLAVREGEQRDDGAGSRPYMAPEQFDRHRQCSTTLDIYATGVILYEMICGIRPIPQDGGNPGSEAGWLYHHQNTSPLPPSHHIPNLPEGLCKVVLKCLAKNPKERFQSFAELRQTLVRIAGLRVCTQSKNKPVKTEADLASEAYDSGVSADALGHLEEALGCYREAIKHEPLKSQQSEAWCNMGKVLGTMTRHVEALECFDRALRIKSSDPHALVGRAGCLTQTRRYQEALNAIEKAIRLDQNNADAHACKANIFKSLGQLASAENSYKKALSIDDRHLYALNGLGFCAELKGNLQVALEYWERVIAIDSDNGEAYAGRCRVLTQLGRKEEAVESGKLGVFYEPSNPWCHIQLGMTYGALEKFQEAKEQFEQVVQLNANSGIAYLCLAKICEEEGDFAKAEEYAIQAVRLNEPGGEELLQIVRQKKQ